MLWLVGGKTATSVRNHLRKVSERALLRGEARPGQPVEVLNEVTRVVWLMNGERKIVEKRVVIGLVAGLQRVDENQGSARLQHPPDLGDDRAAHPRRQLI